MSVTLRLVLAGVVLVGGCRPGTPAPAPGTADAGRDVAAGVPDAGATPDAAAGASRSVIARLDLGNAVGGDGRVLVPTLAFAPGDTFHATLVFAPGATPPPRVGIRWSHLDSQQRVLEEERVLPVPAAATTFQASLPGGWPVGRYRVEVIVGGATVQARVFDVRAAAPAASD